MAGNTSHTLSDYVLPLGLSAESAQSLNSFLSSTKGVGQMRALREAMIDEVLTQVHRCSFAIVKAKREKNVVIIDWQFSEHIDDSTYLHICGSAWEISLIPSFAPWAGGLIVSSHENGSVRLELEEGVAYHFSFTLQRKQANKDDIEAITFQVCIPLSDERKALLRKAVLLNSDPEEAIRHEMNTFLRKRATLDESLRNAIEEIKAKKLSSEDEQEAIEDINDLARSLKDKFGI
jgi:hypothetical protein